MFINDLLHHKKRLKESGRKWKGDSYEKEILIVQKMYHEYEGKWRSESGQLLNPFILGPVRAEPLSGLLRLLWPVWTAI